MIKKLYRKILWRISRWWYRVKVWFGWWYCEHCEKMHSPLTTKYEFSEGVQECQEGVYDVPVPRLFESVSEYFYEITKDLHKVG